MNADASGVFQVDFQDGLALPSGFVSPATYRCCFYLRVAETSLANGDLSDAQLEAMFAYLYGPGWRDGNEDGSRYVWRDLKVRRLSEDEVAARSYAIEDPAFRYWYCHILADGSVQKRPLEQF